VTTSESHIEGKVWGIGDVALALLAVVVGAVVILAPAAGVAAVLARGTQLEEHEGAMAALLGGNIAVEALLLLLPLWVVMRRGHKATSLGWRWPRRAGIWAGIGALTAAYAILGVYGVIVQALGLDELQPKSAFPEVVFERPVLIALVGVMVLALAPIAEETFFRGFVFGGLRRRWGIVWAALASGVLFGLMHLQAGAIVPFTAIGVVFALAYSYTGSLLPSIWAHLAFNSVSFGVLVASS